MGPTGSTGAELGRELERRLQDLLDLYDREHRLYCEVLDLSRRQQQLIRERASLGRIREILEAKRERLSRIGEMEREHGPARRYWRQRGHLLQGPLAVRLQQRLQDVGGLIERILQEEAENDRLFLEQARETV